MALQEHELGDGTLDGLVVAADDACLLQMIAAAVTAHLDSALHALADVDDDLAVLRSFAQGVEQPGALGGIARAEGAHHDGLQVRRVDDMADEVFADAGEEREDDHVVVEPEMGGHRLREVGLQDALTVVGDVHACLHQMGVVERLEGIELLGALLRGAVAAEQMASETDAYLGHAGMTCLVFRGSNLHSGDEVLLAVGTQLSDRQLGTREDDGLGEVLQHIGEGRGGVGHRVGAVEHHKTVVVGIVVGDAVGELRPARRRHVAGVDGRVELIDVDRGIKLLQFGHVDDELLEVEGLQSTRLRVAFHADGTTGIDK